MSRPANPVRGEASIRVAGETLVLRPSFAALVAAEGRSGRCSRWSSGRRRGG